MSEENHRIRPADTGVHNATGPQDSTVHNTGPAPDADGHMPGAHMDTPGTRRLSRRGRIALILLGLVVLYSALRLCGPTSEQPSPTTSATTPAAPATGPTSTVTPRSGPDAPPGSGSDADSAPSDEQQQAATTIAQRFATDFATPGRDLQDWWSRVTRWTTPALAEQLRYTDIHRVAAATVTAVDLQVAGPTVADFRLSYDGEPAFVVRVERDRQTWQVTTVLPAQTPG